MTHIQRHGFNMFGEGLQYIYPLVLPLVLFTCQWPTLFWLRRVVYSNNAITNTNTNNPEKPTKYTMTKTIDQYINDEKVRFYSVSAKEWNSPKYNSNIDPRHFDPQYNWCPSPAAELVQAEIAAKWKYRILMESTPQGVVYMYYDSVAMSFHYIATTNISRDILNVCAMKYVRVFFCRSLFDDTILLPDNIDNKNHELDMAIDELEKEMAPKKSEYIGARITVDPKILPKIKNVITHRLNKEPVLRCNRFKLVGKSTADIKIIQKYPAHTKNIIPLSFAEYRKNMIDKLFNENQAKRSFIVPQSLIEYNKMMDKLHGNQSNCTKNPTGVSEIEEEYVSDYSDDSDDLSMYSTDEPTTR